MGVALYPFSDINTAKKFKKLMDKPEIIAKVEKESDGSYSYYRWSSREVDSVYSSDSFGMYIDDVADKKKKDFDIKKYFAEDIKFQVWYFDHQIDTEFDPKAYKIVRESLKLPFGPERGQKVAMKAAEILEVLKKNKLKMTSISVNAYDPKMKWTEYALGGGFSLPEKYKKQQINFLQFDTTSKKAFKSFLKELGGIVEVTSKKGWSKDSRCTVAFTI